MIMQETAKLYGVSEQTLYRALAQRARPRALRRADRGTPRVLPQDKMEYYCELIAAIKVRTSNKKGRHLSTGEAIRLIEEFGVETPEGLIKAQKSMFKTTTVNRYLRQWGYDHETLRRQPAAVRFQAEHSNDCWQFDLSPSDLKQIKEPLWLQPNKSAPTLMLFSVVDDRSGVAYQEYRCVYGEDVEAALRFLFNAMAPKQIDAFPFQGIPKMIYTDSGPVAKSRVFQQVMRYLDIDVRAHLPQGKDGRRVTARSKTKIESVITDDAVGMLSEKLSTPLQFEYYLTRALEEAYEQDRVVKHGGDRVWNAAREMEMMIDIFLQNKTQEFRNSKRSPNRDEESQDTPITVRLPGATSFNKSCATWTSMCALTYHKTRTADGRQPARKARSRGHFAR